MLLFLLLEDNLRIGIGIDRLHLADADADAAGLIRNLDDTGIDFHSLDQDVTWFIQVIVGNLRDMAQGVNFRRDIDESAKREHPDDNAAYNGADREPCLNVTVRIFFLPPVTE